MATQANRQLAISTPLDDDVLLLTQFSGEEAISRPFSFHLEMLSENWNVRPQEIVGKNVTCSIKLADGTSRYFNGYICRFAGGGTSQRYRRYQAQMVPWLWFLSRTTDCRIFQEQTVPEIIEAVLADFSFAQYETNYVIEDAGAITQRRLDYCVQYRENDFQFVCRLMEEHGIRFYFRHEETRHVLVLTNTPASGVWCAEREVEVIGSDHNPNTLDGIVEWDHGFDFRSSRYAHTDYDFTQPDLDLLSSADTLPQSNLPNRPADLEMELFDYPGGFNNLDNGRQLAEIHMEEEELYYNIAQGKSICRSFAAGAKFTLKDSQLEAEDNQTYMLTRVRHEASEPAGYETESDEQPAYENTFDCIPATVKYAPDRITERPLVHGPQTAVVVGPDGEDVHTDEYGRVKVQFHWDRYGENNENSSCWVRVSQTWAGDGWGSMHIPWIGHEVVVDFLEGNPDRPLITGRVYNANQKVPLDLPSEKYKNVVARDQYGNEIVFDHTEGDEHIRIRSPHHASIIDIGLSVQQRTESDYWCQSSGDKNEAVYGNTTLIEIGTDNKLVVGALNQCVVGLISDIWLGARIGLAAGVAFNGSLTGEITYTKGFSYTCVTGRHLEDCSDSYVRRNKKNILFDSDDTIALLGGEKDQALGKFATDELVLAFGENTPDVAGVTEDAQKKTILKLAAVGVGAGVLGLVGGVVAATAVQNAEEDNSSAATGAAIIAAEILFAAAIAGLAAVGIAASTMTDPTEKGVDHTAGDIAKLEICADGIAMSSGEGSDTAWVAVIDDGNIDITNTGNADASIYINTKKNLEIGAETEVSVDSPKFVFKSGAVQHPNFTVDE